MAIPFGRWLGVHVRLHLSFLLLLVLSAGYSEAATGSLLRGIGLWLALVVAVLVREVARAIAAAYAGVSPRALFLLPFGGVMALEPREGGLPKRSQRLIAVTGSLANLGVALLLLGFAYGVDPAVRLLQQPWISIEHILRSAVWLQAGIGLVNLLPTRGLSLQRLLRLRSAASGPQGASAAEGLNGSPAASPAPGAGVPTPAGRRRLVFGPLTALALALVFSGFVTAMLWPVLLGLTVLFMGYVNRLATVGAGGAAQLTVGDVMLSEYLPLAASGTLREALRRANGSVHETFPVVRGDRLVGWISRHALAMRLQTEGDGYLQGAMVRSLQAAQPGEKLGEALKRAAALGASEFVPVVEDGAMVGILTPTGLERAVGQIRLTQPQPERGQA